MKASTVFWEEVGGGGADPGIRRGEELEKKV